MNHRVNLQPAFVLHARPFRDTSLLVDLLTSAYGRFTLLARGIRARKSRLRGMLTPFNPLLVSWAGKTDLPTLTSAEPSGLAYNLLGNRLISGLYLNELLTHLLHRHDPHPGIYHCYQKTLIDLQNGVSEHLILRGFEKQLLADLGYGLLLDQTAAGEPILSEDSYYFEFGVGLKLSASSSNDTQRNEFKGKSLLALHRNELLDADEIRDAKRLLRLAIGALLGPKSIKSREIFLKIV